MTTQVWRDTDKYRIIPGGRRVTLNSQECIQNCDHCCSAVSQVAKLGCNLCSHTTKDGKPSIVSRDGFCNEFHDYQGRDINGRTYEDRKRGHPYAPPKLPFFDPQYLHAH